MEKASEITSPRKLHFLLDKFNFIFFHMFFFYLFLISVISKMRYEKISLKFPTLIKHMVAKYPFGLNNQHDYHINYLHNCINCLVHVMPQVFAFFHGFPFINSMPFFFPLIITPNQFVIGNCVLKLNFSLNDLCWSESFLYG